MKASKLIEIHYHYTQLNRPSILYNNSISQILRQQPFINTGASFTTNPNPNPCISSLMIQKGACQNCAATRHATKCLRHKRRRDEAVSLAKIRENQYRNAIVRMPAARMLTDSVAQIVKGVRISVRDIKEGWRAKSAELMQLFHLGLVH